jgi:hypothetical protein
MILYYVTWISCWLSVLNKIASFLSKKKTIAFIYCPFGCFYYIMEIWLSLVSVPVLFNCYWLLAWIFIIASDILAYRILLVQCQTIYQIVGDFHLQWDQANWLLLYDMTSDLFKKFKTSLYSIETLLMLLYFQYSVLSYQNLRWV